MVTRLGDQAGGLAVAGALVDALAAARALRDGGAGDPIDRTYYMMVADALDALADGLEEDES